jgi:6-phosphogluconolactonase/Glucosamine-6-phosphate isomerase/deaminase
VGIGSLHFGDERCVPPDDPQSNFRMARENLFVPAAVPEKSIMRMRGEIDPQIAAQEYEDQLNAIATGPVSQFINTI